MRENKCYRQSEEYKEVIRQRDGYTCQLCGTMAMQVDHVRPWSSSHDSSPGNLRVLCKPCNLTSRRFSSTLLSLADWYKKLEEGEGGHGLAGGPQYI